MRLASADASFRRYFRVDTAQGSCIIMDAPPDKEDSRAFVKVAQLMQQAHIRAAEVLAWDEAKGFMLLTDLGAKTMMQVINPAQPEANQALYLQAVDTLVEWQLASKPDVLPPYDEALLRRELNLFPRVVHHPRTVASRSTRPCNSRWTTRLNKSLRPTWPGPASMCTGTSCPAT